MAAEEGRRSVGLITIGRAPRVDMVPEMETWLGPVRTIERGALDEMTPDGIAALRPTPDDYTLITRLSDSLQVLTRSLGFCRSVLRDVRRDHPAAPQRTSPARTARL
jgi:hypothetical protein